MRFSWIIRCRATRGWRIALQGLVWRFLCFVVSGISKICALPQMKLAWMVAVGPGSEEALARLEVIADTYLSMNAPVQRALPVWLAGREGMQKQIRDRVAENLAALDWALGDQPEEEGAGEPPDGGGRLVCCTSDSGNSA